MTGVSVTRSGPSLVLRLGRASVLARPRGLAVDTVLVGFVAALGGLSLAYGTTWLPLADVVGGLTATADEATTLIVREFRLPRVLVGLLVGLALGVSGALVQAVTRNPIAAPDVIGVTAGASAGAVFVLLAFGGTAVGYGGPSAGLAEVGVPTGAVVGAFAAALLVLSAGGTRTSGGRLSFSAQRVVLAGIVCHAAFIGLVHWGLAAADVDQATKAKIWLVGSLHGRGWEHVSGVLLALGLLLPLALALCGKLNTLAIGESSAATLGVGVTRTQLGLLTIAFALTGTAAAAAGPINFVALLAPQIARKLVRGPGVPLVASALTGAGLLLAADFIARIVIPGSELPAGAVTALVGAPFLVLLVVRMGGRR
ncbi:MAG: iron chelate uptake ABC transporter family permease subunit [Actinophytocola sp.]|nr:iron chelate uptake ABC transporter family permease subunit [Actinophytocola sp.]